jgi:hypothetical protein
VAVSPNASRSHISSFIASELRGHHPKRNWIVGGAVIVAVVVAIGYVLVLHNFNSQEKRETAKVFFGDDVSPTDPNNLEVQATMVGIDDKANQMTIRLSVYIPPQSIYVDSNGLVKSQSGTTGPFSSNATIPPPLTLYLVGDTSNSAFPIFAGQPISTVDQTVDLFGNRTNYPFDSYNVTFHAFINDATGKQIQTVNTLTGGVHGFKIEPSIKIDAGGNEVTTRSDGQLHLRISRATSTLFFANFTMVSMWALALAGVAIALMLMLKRRDIGTAALGYLAALLFAFPGIRLALPGSPEVGSKFDFLAFFWCETIVALTLVFLAGLWITRETRADGQSAELKAIQALADRLEAGAVPAPPHREATEEHKSKP